MSERQAHLVPFTEPWFRAVAARRLHQAPSDAIFDPRSGKSLGPSDWDLNPELASDLALMDPPRAAAVLVPLVAHAELTVLFTIRTDHLPTHAGQVAFPGGKMEEGDASPVDTALREAEEEIGLSRTRIEPVGFLDSYRTGKGFHI